MSAPLEPLERPWTVEEAATFLSLDRETIRRMARAGRLPAMGKAPGGGWRFAPADVRAVLTAKGDAATQVRREDVATLKAQLDAAYARSVLQGRTG